MSNIPQAVWTTVDPVRVHSASFLHRACQLGLEAGNAKEIEQYDAAACSLASKCKYNYKLSDYSWAVRRQIGTR